MWPWSGVELRDIGGRRSRSRSVGYSLRGCNVWPRYTLMASCSDAPQTAPRQPMPAVEQSMGPFFEFQLLIAVTYIHASVQLMQKSFLKFCFHCFQGNQFHGGKVLIEISPQSEHIHSTDRGSIVQQASSSTFSTWSASRYPVLY